MTETSRFSEGDESIADFSERHSFCVTASTLKGPTTFSAAFAEADNSFSSPGLAFLFRPGFLFTIDHIGNASFSS
jgi:hypothetical protein